MWPVAKPGPFLLDDWQRVFQFSPTLSARTNDSRSACRASPRTSESGLAGQLPVRACQAGQGPDALPGAGLEPGSRCVCGVAQRGALWSTLCLDSEQSERLDALPRPGLETCGRVQGSLDRSPVVALLSHAPLPSSTRTSCPTHRYRVRRAGSTRRRTGRSDDVRMMKSSSGGRDHRRDLPPPLPARTDPAVHVAQRRIEQAARLAEDMRPTGGKHRREDV